MKLPEQVRRLGLVVGVLLVTVVALRFFVIPPGFFSRQQHEAAAVKAEIAKPVSFAGMVACQDCHQEEYEIKANGFHRSLSCETCHGPCAKHADDPENVKPYAPRDRKFCPVCHQYDSARPTGFPQIIPTAHNPRKPCITCHRPHDPVPSEVPKECSACHAQIERTKAVSSHALLSCTTCHTVGEDHRKTPRIALPTKPTNREFCGQCHATGATDTDSPKVDLATHGGAYLCWHCHYPHQPEGRQ